MAKRQVPSIGRIVHYRLDQGPNKGEYRPAIIVRTWGNTPESAVQLLVFTDAGNDGLDPVVWRTSVACGDGYSQYKWPEYVPPVETETAEPGRFFATGPLGSVSASGYSGEHFKVPSAPDHGSS